jgi:hypothetical protein
MENPEKRKPGPPGPTIDIAVSRSLDSNSNRVDLSSLPIFIGEEITANPKVSKYYTKLHESDSSSNCDEKEHLDKISVIAIGGEDGKACRGQRDFMTPKKKGKGSEDDDGKLFQLYQKEKNEEMTHSANRLKSKPQNQTTRSYNSFTGIPNLERKQSDNYTFNDDGSEKC